MVQQTQVYREKPIVFKNRNYYRERIVLTICLLASVKTPVVRCRVVWGRFDTDEI
jgi:hypothetical protein